MDGIKPFVSALCLVLLSSLLPHSTAETKILTLTSEDRPLISIHKFAFSHYGRVSVSASGVFVDSRMTTADDPSRLGFVLISQEELKFWLSRGRRYDRLGHRKCLLNSSYGRTLFTFLELSQTPRAAFNSSYPVNILREYSLLFVNCLSSNPRVSMTVRTEFYNLGHGGSRNYLSRGQEQLIPIFTWFSLAYFALLCLWISLYNDKKRSVLRIHWLMFALLLIKGLNLVCSAVEMHSVRDFGTPPRGFYLISRTFSYYLFYTIEALIMVGLWKSKSALHPKVRIMTLITVVVQIIANVGLFSLGVERMRTNHEFKKWSWVFILTNLGCFLPIVASAAWNIRSLKEALESDEKGATSKLSEMKKLLWIYVAGIGYLHFVYLFLFQFQRAVNVSKGMGTAVEEGAHLALCAIMLYVFRPESKDGFDYRNVNDVEKQIEEDHNVNVDAEPEAAESLEI